MKIKVIRDFHWQSNPQTVKHLYKGAEGTVPKDFDEDIVKKAIEWGCVEVVKAAPKREGKVAPENKLGKAPASKAAVAKRKGDNRRAGAKPK